MSEKPVPFVDMGVVNEPHLGELRAAFERVLATSQFVGGEEVARFERMLAEHTGTAHAVGLNSGTAALQLALQAADIGPGDEVIIPANTFFATAEAVVNVGADPVLVDCEQGTALIDANAAEAAVTERTAALIPVHLYGQPVDMDRMRAIADRHGLFLLEDNAQAIGGMWNGKQTGSLGDAAAFSFYPGKNLGALGEGGAVTTDNEMLASRIDSLRGHGSLVKYHHEDWGYNERLHGLQGAFLAAKLPGLAQAQALRDQAVQQYRDLLQHPDITWFETQPGARHVWHLLVLQVPQRDAVLETLHESGIHAAIHYPVPIHLTPAAGEQLGKLGQFPVCEEIANNILSMPLFAGITSAQVERAAITLRNTIDHHSGN
jgi:dTDP-4-amino-4,6-dideoxygalactose transaminase